MEKFQPLNSGWTFSPDNPETLSIDNVAPDFRVQGAAPIIVPGFWNTFPEVVGGDWGAYRHHDYREPWQAAESGCYRLAFDVEDFDATQPMRRLLKFDGVLGDSRVWLNGEFLGRNRDPFLPFTLDVTKALRPAGNELIVRVDPPPRDENGHWLQPCGSWVGWFNRGIWQPVTLKTVPLPGIAGIFVQPSVREQRLAVDVTLDTAPEVVEVTVTVEIRDREKIVLMMEPHAVVLMPDSQAQIRLEREWLDPRYWSPEDPHRYHCRVAIRIDGDTEIQHAVTVPFGFREFWIEDTHFVLNGERLRLFGDSWHYMGAAQQNPAYARTWFEFAKSFGVNAIRTHAMPYPEFYFDVADELGMLIIDESAVYGSAGTLAFDKEEFWENARDHIRRLVQRDRNHPSVIFWSACNETVWKGGETIFPGLQSLAETARANDPTRFVSFDENDCEVGGAAPLHAGHYGTPTHWDRAWRRDRPLVVHEFSSLYHGGPEYVSPLGGEAVYADYHTRLEFAGEDAADMFDRLRALGTASITPWNLNWYCLTPWLDTVEYVAPEVTAGGAPLGRIGSGALTLNYGYLPTQPKFIPNAALEPLRRSYRRQRIWCTHVPRQGFAGHTITVTGYIWNDCSTPLKAELRLAYVLDDVLEQTTQPIELPANAEHDFTLFLQLPEQISRGTCELSLQSHGDVLDQQEWAFAVCEPATATEDRPTFVLGDDIDDLLEVLKAQRVTLETIDRVVEAKLGTLVLAKTKQPRRLNEWLADERIAGWLARGGRIMALLDSLADDATSALTPIRREITRAFVTCGDRPALKNVTDDDLVDWGPDGIVAKAVFERPATGPMCALLCVGESAAGLAHSPMVCCPYGAGNVLLTGLCLAERFKDTPAARDILIRFANFCLTADIAHSLNNQDPQVEALLESVGAVSHTQGDVLVCDGGVSPPDMDFRQHLADGGTVLVNGLKPESVAAWAQTLGLSIDLRPDECCNVVRCVKTGLIRSATNWDLCWVDRDTAQPIVRHTLAVDDPAARTLVETTATQWRGYQTAHEQQKVAMMLRRMREFAGPRAALVEIPRGAGRIILNQLCLHEASGPFKNRAMRIMTSWLDELAVKRDPTVSPLTPIPQAVCRSDGYLAQWAVLGPFEPVAGHALDHAYIDEAVANPFDTELETTPSWRIVSSAFAHVDLTGVFEDLPPRDRVAYAALEVYSAQDRSVLLDAPDMVALLTGADGGVKVWLNGQPVGRFDFVRELVLDSDRMTELPLRQGWNSLLIKLHNPSGAWRFAARFQSATGEPVSDLQYRLPAELKAAEVGGGYTVGR